MLKVKKGGMKKLKTKKKLSAHKRSGMVVLNYFREVAQKVHAVCLVPSHAL